MQRGLTSREATLGEFIDENHRVLSSVGIFAALTVFTNSIEPRGLSALVSLFFLAATMLTSWELLRRFPSNRTFLLNSFHYILELGIYGIAVSWLLMARRASPVFVVMFLSILIGYVLTRLTQYALPRLLLRLVEKIRIPDWLGNWLANPSRRNLMAKAIGYPFAFVVILISVYLATMVFPRVDSLLGRVQLSLESLPRQTPEPVPEKHGGPFVDGK